MLIKKFNLFKRRKLVQDDVNTISDLFLEISQDLNKVEYIDDDFASYGTNQNNLDNYMFEPVIDRETKEIKSIYIEVSLKRYYNKYETDQEWLDSFDLKEYLTRDNILRLKIKAFISRLKKFNYKVKLEIDEPKGIDWANVIVGRITYKIDIK